MTVYEFYFFEKGDASFDSSGDFPGGSCNLLSALRSMVKYWEVLITSNGAEWRSSHLNIKKNMASILTGPTACLAVCQATRSLLKLRTRYLYRVPSQLYFHIGPTQTNEFLFPCLHHVLLFIHGVARQSVAGHHGSDRLCLFEHTTL